jgi:hypothetical protein
VEASEVEAERSATITIHVEGATDIVLTVTQAAYVPPITAPAAVAKWTVAAPGNLEWYKYAGSKQIGNPAGSAPATIAGPEGIQAWALVTEDHIKVINPLSNPTTVYSLLWDIRMANFNNYHPLLQTTVDNNDGDADVFIAKDATLGLGSYSSEKLKANTWHRVVVTVDIPNNMVIFYLDGINVKEKPITSDGDISRYTLHELFWIFLDDGTEDEAIDFAGLAIWDVALSAGEVADLETAGKTIK